MHTYEISVAPQGCPAPIAIVVSFEDFDAAFGYALQWWSGDMKVSIRCICDQDMACEVRALHAMNADHTGLQRCAFGQLLPDREQPINPLREFYYSIRLRNGRLLLEVDGYAARHGMDIHYEEDADLNAWEAGLIKIEGPATRENYYRQHRIARGLLRGLDAILDDGVIKGISNVEPLGAYNETPARPLQRWHRGSC